MTAEPASPLRGLRDRASSAGLWTAAVPALVALTLLWLPDPRPVSSPALRWTLSVLVLASWLGGGLAMRAALRERVRTLTNVVSALREGDYSIRASAGDEAVDELASEINRLARGLREERLTQREATALVSRVIEEIGAGLFAFDGQRCLVLANQQGARWLGRRPADLVGEHAADIGLAECLEGDALRILELDLARGPGRYEVRRAGFRAEGRPHELIVLNDLTLALAAEERQAWKRMVQVLRHEINNSLAPIRSIAVMLRDGAGRRPRPERWDDDLIEGLDVVVSRTDALARIIEAFRLLTRLPAPQRRLFAVEDWVDDAVRQETRRTVRVEGGPGTMLVADRGQLDQLLVNLIRNATDAAGETDGDVTIRWRETAGAAAALELDVIDGGPGLSGRENLFVPFFTTKPDGTGIGLALSRQIAEAHDGRLTLENRRDAGGCIARLHLPLNSSTPS